MANEHKTFELVVEPRGTIGKQVKQLRREELVPAVVYGYKVEPEAVQVAQKELERIYLRAGNSNLVDLKIGESGKPRKVFIHNVQRSPIGHNLLHVDFMAVNLTQEMTLSVPIALTGESPAAKADDAILTHGLDHVQARALPSNIPSVFELSIESLEEIDQALHVSDLEVPEGVTILNAPEEMIVKVSALKIEEEPVEEEEEAE